MGKRNKTEHPLLWARLHSDGVFIGLLGVLAGARILFDPMSDDLVREVGNEGFAAWRAGMLLAGGGLVVVGFLRTHIVMEIIGRIVMVWTVLFALLRGIFVLPHTHTPFGIELNLSGDFVTWNAATLVAFATLTYFRIDALTAKPGFVISIPPLETQVAEALKDQRTEDAQAEEDGGL